MGKSKIPDYYFWISQAQRWGKCVNYGSPLSAWTPEMIAAKTPEEKAAALKKVRE